jgi:hypothetical protein
MFPATADDIERRLETARGCEQRSVADRRVDKLIAERDAYVAGERNLWLGTGSRCVK